MKGFTYAENKIMPTRCELIDRENFMWWASDNTTGTERNTLIAKIECHIKELVEMLGEIKFYQGYKQEGFDSIMMIEEIREEIIKVGNKRVNPSPVRQTAKQIIRRKS